MNTVSLQVAVLIPAYNEEVAIAATIKGFREAIPGASIYVYDNNSKDNTREVAQLAGAIVRTESLQEKGNVSFITYSDVD